MSPESRAENAAKMATNKLLENSRNSSKSRSNSKPKSVSKARSRSPLLTAKDKAVNGGSNVYVNPATQLGNIASYGNQFDQPERVGYIYKSQNNGTKFEDRKETNSVGTG